MKKLLSIFTAVVLIVTTVFSVSMFTVSATEGQTSLVDNVRLNNWVDEMGRRVNLIAGDNNTVPSNIATANVTLTENVTKLPLTSLFEMRAPSDASDATAIKLPETIDPSEVKGAIFYVEIPDFGTVSHSYETSTVASTSDKFRFAIQFNGKKADGTTDLYGYKWGYVNYYIRGVNDTSWSSSYVSNYGIELSSGWKGYVLVPFDIYEQANVEITEDVTINQVLVRALKNTTDVFSGADSNTVTGGYVPDDKPLVVSEPIWMLGNMTEGCTDFTGMDSDTVIIGQTEYDYNTGKALTVARPDASGLTAAMQSLYSSTGAYINTTTSAGMNAASGSREEIASLSPLTDSASIKTNNFRNQTSSVDAGHYHAAAFTFAKGATLPDNGGYLVYVEMPSVAGEHQLYSNRYTSEGAYATNGCSDLGNSTLTWYVLPDGSTAWQEKSTTGGYSLKFDDAVEGVSPEFKGWVYIPSKFWRSIGPKNIEIISLQPASYNYVNGNYSPNNPVNGFKFSGMTAIKAFDPAKTIVVGDNNKVVDIATGEEIDIDYYSADEFIGDATLLNNGDNKIISLDVVKLCETPIAGAVPAANTYSQVADRAGSLKYVDSVCAISKMPSVNVKGTVTTGRTALFTLDFDSNETHVMADDIDGFMVYLKVNSTEPVWFNIGAANKVTSDGGATYTNDYASNFDYRGGFSILPKGEKEWRGAEQLSTNGEDTQFGTGKLPAGFEGYVYFSKFGTMEQSLTKVWRINFYAAADSEANTNVDLDFGALMTVKAGTWTTETPNVAFVNGNDVAQNMFTGDFTVVNDMDGNLSVDIADLVRGADGMSATQYAKFRKEYLDKYFFQ